jgi:biopolymer transport protein ExbB
MQIFIDAYEAIRDFLELGGPVLRVIAVLILVMWILILERLIYFNTTLKSLIASTLKEWEQRRERQSWEAHQIRTAMISRVREQANKGLPMIQTFVALCPLFGLLGTVTGMVAVFQVMAATGAGNARSMADGVSMATVPTMAGMVGMLSGIFLVTVLTRMMRRRVGLLEDEMTMDH